MSEKPPTNNPNEDLRGRKHNDSKEVIQAREEALLKLGLGTDAVERIRRNLQALYSPERMEKNLEVLEKYHFKNPLKTIQKFELFGFTDSNISKRIEFLKQLGFEDPVKLIETAPPTVLGLSEETVLTKIKHLKEQGFPHPISLLEKRPGILGYSSEHIVSRIQFLRAEGVTDPIKVLTTSPTIFDYSEEENLKPTIAFLKNEGFNAGNLINKFPPILGYSVKSMQSRLAYFRKVIEMYGLSNTIDVIAIMERNTALWSTKREKLSILFRLLSEYQTPKDEVESLLKQLVTANLDDLMIAYSELQGSKHSLREVIRKSEKVKTRNISKVSKRKYLTENNPLEQPGIPHMINTRYQQGYKKSPE